MRNSTGRNSWTTQTPILCMDQRNLANRFLTKLTAWECRRYYFSASFFERRFKNASAFFPSKPSRDTTTDVKCLLYLETGLQILLLFLVLGRFYNDGMFTSQVRSLINITDANIYDTIIQKPRMRRLPRSELMSHCTPVWDSMIFLLSTFPPLS